MNTMPDKKKIVLTVKKRAPPPLDDEDICKHHYLTGMVHGSLIRWKCSKCGHIDERGAKDGNPNHVRQPKPLCLI